MSDVKKQRVFENKTDRKEVVRVLDVVSHSITSRNEVVVVFRKIQPLLKSSTVFNQQYLDFDDFIKGEKKVYLTLEEFEANYRWFVEEPETQARLREGFYDNN